MTLGLICIAGKPAMVPENMIMAIQRMLKKANSSVLGMPDEIEYADALQTQTEVFSGNGKWLDVNLSGGDRARLLLQMLNSSVSIDE